MLKPFVFVRRPEFAMVWGVYASTYMAANAIMTTCERHETRPAWPKFFGTTFVNLATCIVKVRHSACYDLFCGLYMENDLKSFST